MAQNEAIYYYGTEDSSREFDASADEEDELYEEEDGAMSGQTDDYGIGIGQEIGALIAPAIVINCTTNRMIRNCNDGSLVNIRGTTKLLVRAAKNQRQKITAIIRANDLKMRRVISIWDWEELLLLF
ncbi:hypothetical protein niasHS_016369 [Heterodera schachtii]|uniref:Uncharacterized protein n=1 Tax=Heterodera schachtii TaxID=97005 RepID=A0ABD2HVF8_HETSC